MNHSKNNFGVLKAGLKCTFKARFVVSVVSSIRILSIFTLLFVLSSGYLLGSPSPAQAQTPNTTLNFQARILTAGGALVPDGNYNLEFKIYDSSAAGGTAQGVCSLNSSTDDCWWLETRTGANVVRVVNGYVSVNLGSVTAFGTSIPWSQDLYVVMRVGGIGAPSWDATEMTNATTGRMKISAVPLAFVANNVRTADRTAANSDNITIQTGTTTTSGNSGNIAIDAGGAAGTKGTITLGATNASALTLGRAGLTTSNAGALTVTQLLTGNLGLTVTGGATAISGGTIDLNVSGANPTNIATGGTGLVSVGNGTGTFALNSNTLDISTLGVLTGATGITSSGSITFSGLSTAGIVTNTAGGVLGTTGTIGVTLGGTGTSTTFTQGSVVFAGASGVYSQDNASLFFDDTNNRLGIGANGASAGKLEVNGAPGGTDATIAVVKGTATGTVWQDGLYANLTVTPSGASTGPYYAIESTITTASSNLTTVSDFSTLYSHAHYTGTGTLNVEGGASFGVINSSTGTITTAYGTWVYNHINSGGGTIANSFGSVLMDQTTGSTSRINLFIDGGANPVGNWSIYNSSTYNNAIAGNLRVGGTTAPTVALDVTGAALVSTTLGVTGATTLSGGLTVQNATATDDQILTSVTTGGAARFAGTITNADFTAARTFTLPNETGTICTTAATGACSATGGGYVQLAPAAAQTDGTTNASININKTGASGFLLQLTVSAAQRFTADFSGNLVASGTYNTNTFTGSALTFGSAATATVQSAAAQALTLTSNNAATWSTSAGALTLQGFAGVTVTTPTAAATSSATITTGVASAGTSGATNINTGAGTTGTGNIALLTGNASAGAAGNIALDVGTSSAGNGSILIGTATRAQTITIGNTTGGALRVGQNGSTVQIDGTNFDVATTGVVTLAGAQAQDINTAVTAGEGAALVIQPGTSTGASSNGGATTIKGGDGSGTTTVTGGNLTLVAGSATGGAGTRTGGATSLDAGFGGAAGTNGGAITIGTTNASAITIGRTGIVTTFNSTILQKSDSATAFVLQDSTGGFNNLTFDSSTNHLKVYDHTAPRTAYADIYYSGGTAVFAASTGTTQVGNGTGDVNVLLTNNSEKFNFSHTGTNAISTDTDFIVTRNLTGTTNALQGNIAKIEDLSTFTSGSSAPNLLYINQNNSSATGNLILAQTGGSTTKFSVSTAGNTLVAGALTVNTGSTTSGGTVNINASSNFATNINTGTSTGAIGIGNSLAGAISLQSASNINALGNNILVKTTTNSTTGFQVQNAVGAPAFRVDTTPLNTLIANGGAEDTSMVNWALKAGTGTVVRSGVEAYQGNNSTAVTLTSTAVGDGAKYTPSPALSAISYQLSFEIKQTAGTDFSSNIAVGWNNGTVDTDCSLVPTLANKPLLSGFGWYRYVCVFTGSAAGHIYWKQTTVPGVARTFYIDNLQLQTGNASDKGSFYKESSIILGGPITSPVNIEPTADSTTVFTVKDAFQHNILSVDSTVNVVRLFVLNTVSSQGAELVTSQAFNSVNWTTCNGGAGGWTGTATNTTHNTGNVVTCSAAASNFTVASATSYIVTYTVASMTGGTVTPSMGGQNAPRVATNGTFSFIVTTTATTALTFTPNTDFNGVISAVSVKQITESDSILNVDNLSTGTNTLQVRSGSTVTNSFVGTEAGMFNNGGSYSAAYGYQALRNSVATISNSAFGSQAMTNNVTGNNNSAFGNTAGYGNISGSDNVSVGFRSNYFSTSGSGNTSVGNYSGYSLISGSNNTFIGFNAGKDDTVFSTNYNLQNATAIGYNSQVQNSNALVLGGQGANAVSVGIGITAPTNTFQVSPVQYSTGTASVTTGTATVTGVGTTWTSAMIGSTFVFADGRSYVILNVTSTTGITLASNASLTETTSAYRIHYGGFNVTSTATAYLQSTSATAFQILNAAATQLFVADTTNNRIYIGSTTADAVGTTLVLDTKNTASDPTGINGAIYYDTGGNAGANTGAGATTFAGKFRCLEGGLWKNCIGMRDISERRWGYMNISGTTSTALTSTGIPATATISGTAASNQQAESFYVKWTDAGTIGSQGGVNTSGGTGIMQIRYLPKLVTRIRVDPTSVANGRYWIGLFAPNATYNYTVPTASAALAKTYAAIGYESGINGGKWVCASADGTNNSGTDTGVTVTAGHYYDMIIDMSTSGNLTCSVSDNGGAYTSVNKTTNLPAGSTDMLYVTQAASITAVVQAISVAYAYLEYN